MRTKGKLQKSILIVISSIFYSITGIKHFIESDYFLSIIPVIIIIMQLTPLPLINFQIYHSTH